MGAFSRYHQNLGDVQGHQKWKKFMKSPKHEICFFFFSQTLILGCIRRSSLVFFGKDEIDYFKYQHPTMSQHYHNQNTLQKCIFMWTFHVVLGSINLHKPPILITILIISYPIPSQ